MSRDYHSNGHSARGGREESAGEKEEAARQVEVSLNVPEALKEKIEAHAEEKGLPAGKFFLLAMCDYLSRSHPPETEAETEAMRKVAREIAGEQSEGGELPGSL